MITTSFRTLTAFWIEKKFQILNCHSIQDVEIKFKKCNGDPQLIEREYVDIVPITVRIIVKTIDFKY